MQASSRINTVNRNVLSYTHTPQTKPYTYQSVVDALRSKVEKSPHREILIHREPDDFRNSLTYLQLQEKSEHLAKYLISKGIQQGDVIGMFGPNSCEWMIGEMSILMTGGKAVHLHAGTTSVAENTEIIKITHCKGLIVNPGRSNEFKTAIEKLVSNMNSLWKENGFVVYLQDYEKNIDESLTTILAKPINADLPKVKIHPEDTAFIYSTSGSTGNPKLVEVSHFAEANVPDTFMRNEEEEELAKVYCDRPFGWVAGNPTHSLLVGCAHVFCVSFVSTKGKSTEAIWDIVEAEKCTQARFVPYHIYDLINLRKNTSCGKEYYKLKSICVTGQLVGGDIMQVVGTFTDSVVIFYGCTEMYGISVSEDYTMGQSFESGAAGKPVDGYEIKLVDENEDTVPIGETGEIYTRSVLGFNGYLNNVEKTKNTIGRGGWVKTGDVGVMDEIGRLTVKCRKTDIISRGTRKIFPASIELVVNDMKGIEMVFVVGVPDDRLLEEVCVCYTTNKQVEITPNDVNEYCSEKFFQALSTDDGLGLMPKYFLELTYIPLLPNGKIDRRGVEREARKRLLL